MIFSIQYPFFCRCCWQAYRLQQTIHNEIANKLKSIDKLRAAVTTTFARHNDEKMARKIIEQKNRIAEMLKMLTYLKELLQNIPHISIDSFLDLLTHKFHVIETESSVNDLLNFGNQKKVVSTTHFKPPSHLHEPLSTDDISSAYLNDILRRCSELKKSNEKPTEIDTNSMKAAEMNDVVRGIWPDIMNRLENYLDNRKKQIKVDLKRLTSEEEAMVESIRTECVENIIEDLFHSK